MVHPEIVILNSLWFRRTFGHIPQETALDVLRPLCSPCRWLQAWLRLAGQVAVQRGTLGRPRSHSKSAAELGLDFSDSLSGPGGLNSLYVP
jgi:hypothetical protein